MLNTGDQSPHKAPAMVAFNMNSYVYVRLTPAGRAWHAAQFAVQNAHSGRSAGDEGNAYHPPIENPQGFSRWQLWEFMNVFGDAMFAGNPDPVCDMHVLVEQKDIVFPRPQPQQQG